MLLLLVVGTAAFSALGLLMAGALRAEATLAAANGVYLVLLLLGGIVFPLSRLPGALQGFAKVLPGTALATGLRRVLEAGASMPWGDLGLLALWALRRRGPRRPHLPLGVAARLPRRTRPRDAILMHMPRIAVPEGKDPMMYLWTERAPALAHPAGAFSGAVYAKSTLPIREFEAARVRTAQINNCQVCLNFRSATDVARARR